MVQDIEKLDPEFQPKFFRQPGILENSRIPVEESRSEQHVAGRIAVSEWSRNGEGCRIKPETSRYVRLRVANNIGSVAGPPRCRTRECHREGFTATDGGNPRDLPTSEQRRGCPPGRGQEAFSRPERQIINIVDCSKMLPDGIEVTTIQSSIPVIHRRNDMNLLAQSLGELVFELKGESR